MNIDLNTCFDCGNRMTTRREDVPCLELPGKMLLGVNVSRCPNCGEYEVEIPIDDVIRQLARKPRMKASISLAFLVGLVLAAIVVYLVMR